MPRRHASDLRSARWFADTTMRAFAHRQRMQQAGWRPSEFVGRPVIAVVNTWSEMSPCHAHLRERAEAVKRGVVRAGGCPIELPAMSLGEVMVKPTTMLYRNFLAMEAEELLRQNPIDGAVLLGGCDKTTPGLLMGAVSVDVPAIFCPAGPMLNGRWRGQTVGAGTHTRKYWDDYRAGALGEGDMTEFEGVSTRSPGTCNTMGTATTMTSLVDALGLTLPGASSIPAMDSAHARMASACGERIVEMVWEDLKPSSVLSQGSLRNALHVNAALGGSTNAVIHMVALARRAGLSIDLDAFDDAARRTPVLANLFPAGANLMEDFYFAGGLLGLMTRIADRLDLHARTVSGGTVGDALARARVDDDDVIRSIDRPVTDQPGLAVLRGNLAPDGAVIKPSAATPGLLTHRGRAVVFDGHAELTARIDDPDLDVDADSVLVLRGAGPVGAPGMPEWGALPIPRKLLAAGVRDMVRMSDARMSGTHYGTCVLHIAPESHVGGPLCLLRTGDEVVLDVPARRLDMLVDDAELARRRAAWTAPPAHFARGYGAIFQNHVTQANQGCDFDILESGARTPEPEIY
ncbi:L-arabinonate dehydratase [Alsobacter sp. SYSU BS001988]